MASAHARRILRSHMQQYSKEGPYISPHGPHTGFKSLNCINGISSWSQGLQGSFPSPSTMYLALQITVKAARTIKDFILSLSDLQVGEKENISLNNITFIEILRSTISVNFFPGKYSLLIKCAFAMHELRVFIFFLIFFFINDFLVNFVFVNITFNGLMMKLISIYGISCLHSTLFRNKYHREESNNNASCFFHCYGTQLHLKTRHTCVMSA